MKWSIRKVLLDRRMKKRLKDEAQYVNDTRRGIIRSSTGFDTIEAYRSARTNIMFSLVDEEGCKRLIFTSAMAGEGKTTTCINLAVTFARTGANVLVIDADLRLPKIHTYFELDNTRGISDALAGLAQLDDIIQTKDGIDFITAGYIPQNPAELLASRKMEETIRKLSARYDYIFLDTPPVGVVTDAAAIARLSSGVIFVIRQNYTLHSAVEAAFSGLNFANAKVLGFILNDAESPTAKYMKQRYPYSGYYGDGGENAPPRG
jgi:capsular exopolysaccharide synthesis family protein